MWIIVYRHLFIFCTTSFAASFVRNSAAMGNHTLLCLNLGRILRHSQPSFYDFVGCRYALLHHDESQIAQLTASPHHILPTMSSETIAPTLPLVDVAGALPVLVPLPLPLSPPLSLVLLPLSLGATCTSQGCFWTVALLTLPSYSGYFALGLNTGPFSVPLATTPRNSLVTDTY
jgi:hypothetical protein